MDLQRLPSFITQLVFLLMVICSAFIFAYHFHHPESEWIICTVLLLVFTPEENTLLRQLSVWSLICLVAATLIALANIAAWFLLLAVFYLLLVVFLALILAYCYPKYFFPLLIMTALVLLASTASQMITATENLMRFNFMLLAGLLTAVARILTAWHFTRHTVYAKVADIKQSLRLLNREIFACFLQSNYKIETYRFERRIHQQKWNVNQSLLRLRQLITNSPQAKEIAAASYFFDQLYTHLLDCSQLRLRVNDHTVFSVCDQEMRGIQEAIDQSLSALSTKAIIYQHNQPIRLTHQGDAVLKRFEEVYNNVLLVVARDPVIFLLFIASVKNFFTTI
jgi:hypothetical protein